MRLKQAKVGDRFKIDLASRAGKQTPVKAPSSATNFK